MPPRHHPRQTCCLHLLRAGCPLVVELETLRDVWVQHWVRVWVQDMGTKSHSCRVRLASSRRLVKSWLTDTVTPATLLFFRNVALQNRRLLTLPTACWALGLGPTTCCPRLRPWFRCWRCARVCRPLNLCRGVLSVVIGYGFKYPDQGWLNLRRLVSQQTRLRS